VTQSRASERARTTRQQARRARMIVLSAAQHATHPEEDENPMPFPIQPVGAVI
jgi:hypothetical protein